MHYLKEKLYQLIKVDNDIFEFIIKSSNDGIWCFNVDNPANQWMNDGFWATLGYDAEEDKTWQELISAKSIDEVQRNIDLFLKKGEQTYQFDVCFIHKNGEEVWTNVSVVAARNNTGKPDYLIGTIKKREVRPVNTESLKSKMPLYESIVNNQSIFFIRINLSGFYTYANEHFCKVFHLDKNNLSTFYILNHVVDNDHQKCHRVMKECLDNPGSVVKVVLRELLPNKKVICSDWSFVCIVDADGKPVEIEATGKDITSRIEIEKQLKVRNNELRIITDALDNSSLVSITNLQGTIIKVNPLFCKVAKYEAEELIGKNHNIINSGHHSHKFWQNMWHTISKGETWKGEIKNQAKDGSEYWVDSTITPVRNEDGHIKQYLAIRQDITERKVFEQQLIQEKEFSATIIAEMPDGFALLDTNREIIHVNAAMCEITGFDKTDLIGAKAPFPYWPPEEYENIQAAFQKTVKADYPKNLEFTFQKKNGERFPVILSQTAIRDENGNTVNHFTGLKDLSNIKRTEEELQKTKDLLEQTNRVAKLGGWEIDLVNKAGRWSDITRQIHEVSEDFVPTVEGMLNFYKSDEDKERIEHLINTCIEKGQFFDEEFQIRTTSQREVWIRIIGQAEFENNICKRVFGTFQDIDEHKRVEIEAQKINTRLALATKAARVGIWEFDIVNNGLVWDDQMFALYGLRSEDFSEVYDAWKTSLHPDDVQKSEEDVLFAVEGKKEFDTEFRVIRPDGDIRYIRAVAKVHRNDKGEPTLMIGTNWDITDEKRANEKLREAKVQADAANKAKSEFLANMSHEIRTPLNGVIGFTDLLLRSKLNDTQQQYLSTVYQSATSLLDIINNILDFSKIEAGKFELSIGKTDLLGLSRQIIDLIRYQAHRKDLEVLLNISGDVPRFIWIDEVKIRQILVNLLGNATKFTNQGEIELKIDLLEQVTKQEVLLRFSVRDTGIGIAAENKDKIFEAFSQEDSSTTRRFGGTGLGLSISNKLLELMGTKLLVESVEGRGSIFYFDIHLKASTGIVSKGNWQNMEIIKNALIVDDNKNNRQILKEMLVMKDIRAEEVTNGLDALERLAEGKRYDIIFVDYHMPFMDGIETIKNIREELNIPAQKQPIILFHSSSEHEEFSEQCRKLQVHQQLIKPVNIEQLFNCLENLHASHQESQIAESNGSITSDIQELSASILIAEDNEVNMQLSKVIISSLMPEALLMEAQNGKEAVTLYKEQLPDFIFMDIQMPEMNGYEACREIRKMEGAETVPIIALTAGTLKGERERCLAAGMNDYISKPIIKEDFIRIINQWIIPQEKMSIKDHFNQEALLQTIGDNPKIKEKIFAKTKSYLSTVMPDIAESVEKQNLDAIKTIAHTLKGASRSMYLSKLADMAEQLEKIQSLESQQIVQLVDDIAVEIDYVKELI